MELGCEIVGYLEKRYPESVLGESSVPLEVWLFGSKVRVMMSVINLFCAQVVLNCLCQLDFEPNACNNYCLALWGHNVLAMGTKFPL